MADLPGRLARVLTKAERDSYQEARKLIVTGPTGLRYWIDLTHTVNNVMLVDEHTCVMRRWCFGPRMGNIRLPSEVKKYYASFHAAQVLAIKTSEDWMRVACEDTGYFYCIVAEGARPAAERRCPCGCGARWADLEPDEQRRLVQPGETTPAITAQRGVVTFNLTTTTAPRVWQPAYPPRPVTGQPVNWTADGPVISFENVTWVGFDEPGPIVVDLDQSTD